MEVYALSGPSGTGKSASALLFAHTKQIPAIIDDGLLIYNGKKTAGSSAKYEENYITAIKRAVFFYDDHKEEVKGAMKDLGISKILLIGTSKRMVKKIAQELNLGKINHFIEIETIRSSSEIKMALFIRRTKGEHVIPIPSLQIEQSFFKKIISQGTKIFSLQKKVIGETTVVKPNFQLGSIIISPEVLKNIVIFRCKKVSEIDAYGHIKISLGDLPIIKLHVNLKSSIDKNIIDVIKHIQKKIKSDFQQHLNIEVYSVDIHVAKFTYARSVKSTMPHLIDQH